MLICLRAVFPTRKSVLCPAGQLALTTGWLNEDRGMSRPDQPGALVLPQERKFQPWTFPGCQLGHLAAAALPKTDHGGVRPEPPPGSSGSGSAAGSQGRSGLAVPHRVPVSTSHVVTRHSPHHLIHQRCSRDPAWSRGRVGRCGSQRGNQCGNQRGDQRGSQRGSQRGPAWEPVWISVGQRGNQRGSQPAAGEVSDRAAPSPSRLQTGPKFLFPGAKMCLQQP